MNLSNNCYLLFHCSTQQDKPNINYSLIHQYLSEQIAQRIILSSEKLCNYSKHKNTKTQLEKNAYTMVWSIDSHEINKFNATRCQILMLKCTKFDFRWASIPDPAEGAYSASPMPPAIFMGPTSKGREGRGREGNGRGREIERGQ